MPTSVSSDRAGRLALLALTSSLALGGCLPMLPSAAPMPAHPAREVTADHGTEPAPGPTDTSATQAPADPTLADAPSGEPQSPKPVEIVLEDKGPMRPVPGNHEAAGAAADSYVAALVHGMRTLDTAPLEAVSDANCTTCVGHIALIRQYRSEGLTMPQDFDWVSREQMVVESADGSGQYVVLARTTMHDPTALPAQDGSGAQTEREGRWTFIVRPVADGWVVDHALSTDAETFEQWWDEALARGA